MNETLNQVNQNIQEVFGFGRDQVANVAETGHQQQQRPQQRLILPAAERIRRPRNIHGKPAFLDFVREQFPEEEEGWYERVYQETAAAALNSMRELRRNHRELLNVGWGPLAPEHKLSMARDVLAVVLPVYPRLELFRRCVDLWTCQLIIEGRWSQMTSNRGRSRRHGRFNLPPQ